MFVAVTLDEKSVLSFFGLSGLQTKTESNDDAEVPCNYTLPRL